MYCLRCGKETEGEKVFCASCLESMEKYPVKPGQPIVLPTPPAPQSAKRGRKNRPANTEELLDSLRRQLKITGRLFMFTAILLIAAIVLLILQWRFGLLLPTI